MKNIRETLSARHDNWLEAKSLLHDRWVEDVLQEYDEQADAEDAEGWEEVVEQEEEKAPIPQHVKGTERLRLERKQRLAMKRRTR
jgi:hypothetical protein